MEWVFIQSNQSYFVCEFAFYILVRRIDVQDKLQCSLCGAVLSFPLQKLTCFLAILVCHLSLTVQGRKVSYTLKTALQRPKFLKVNFKSHCKKFL